VAFNLGLLLAERGKRDEAKQALRAALEAIPTWPRPRTTSR
jgi:Tfp pilus assembly protein PilF